MAGKRLSDLCGIEVGTWRVMEYTSKSNYMCQCIKCGEQREISGYFIKNGKVPKCYECLGGVTNKGRIDLTNKRFGQWTVLEYAGDKKWTCKCDCGVIRTVAGNDLRNGKSTGCGHSTNRNFDDLTGKQFGEWTAISYAKDLRQWRCRCSCGKIGYLTGYQLRSGESKSCGHNTTGFKDLTGMKFGELTVIKRNTLYEQYKTRNDTYWLCQCSCGNMKTTTGYSLRTGVTTSCGCKTEQKRIETTMNKYGVKHVSQINTNRTNEQLEAISTREKLKEYTEKNFDSKPSTIILADKLGISRGTLKGHLLKYGLEDMVENSPVAESGYEKYLAELFPTEYRNDRTLLDGKEVDLYYPDKNFAIEFNDNYWHSALKKENMNYHQEKSLLAEKKGVQLFHIFEYEWNNKATRDILMSILKMRIYGDQTTVIYARNCTILEIDASIARKFLGRNHIQGYANSRIHIGAFYNNELVGVMTFSKPRFTENYQYELIRLAFKLNTAVVGGAERMFEHFIRNYKPTSIISYCNISKFNGNVYKHLGFSLTGITKPNYIWINLQTYDVLKRYQTTKAKLREMGLGNDNMTEDEIMEKIGYNKIYDCGNKVFVWNNQ